MRERWLVISHEATNSGAPRMLLQVLRGVRAARGPEWSCEIVLRRGGALTREFERLGPVHVLSHGWAEGASWRAGFFRKFIDRPWVQPWRLRSGMKRWEKDRFDLVYNNTGTNGEMLPVMRQLECPIVTHVHELGPVLRRFSTRAAIAQTMEHTDRFIAVSPAAAADLVAAGAAGDRVTVVPNFISALPARVKLGDRGELRRQLGLPDDAAVIVGCGHIHAIKGVDLFIEMATVLAARMKGRVHFVWVGGETDRRFAAAVRRQVLREGLESRVRWAGAVDDVTPWFAASDGVVVTSREESFSMVALEAAAMGRPVAGFAGARGLRHLLGDSAALLAPGHNVAALAQIVEMWLREPGRADQMGMALREKVAGRFLAGPRVADILSVVDAAIAEKKEGRASA